MTITGALELVAWLLSAVIAVWLALDVVRVSRRYDEDALINPGEDMSAPDMSHASVLDEQEGTRT
jgi:uncharacterized membrane protein SpoIIM required for sporulation